MRHHPRSRTLVLASLAVIVAALAGTAFATAANGGGGHNNRAAKINTRLGRIAKHHVPPPPNAVARKQAAAAHPPLVPLSDPQQPVPTGVINMAQAPFPSGQYAIQNRWQKLLPGGSTLQLYAGADGTDPAQGLVIIWTVPDSAPPVVVRAPGRIGSLRIVAANGGMLTLDSASGKHMVFDLASHAFTSE